MVVFITKNIDLILSIANSYKVFTLSKKVFKKHYHILIFIEFL